MKETRGDYDTEETWVKTVMKDAVSLTSSRLVGLAVKASASKAEDLGFDSRLSCGDFCGSSHTSD